VRIGVIVIVVSNGDVRGGKANQFKAFRTVKYGCIGGGTACSIAGIRDDEAIVGCRVTDLDVEDSRHVVGVDVSIENIQMIKTRSKYTSIIWCSC